MKMGLDKFKMANEKQKAKMNKAFEEAKEKKEDKTISEPVKADNKNSSGIEKKEKPKDIPTKPVQKKEEKSKTPGTVGRPRKEPYVKRSLNIPENYISYITVQAGLNFKGNVSDYIISLIEKDMKSNEKLYNAIKNNI